MRYSSPLKYVTEIILYALDEIMHKTKDWILQFKMLQKYK